MKNESLANEIELTDADENLADIFFACARYERPSTDWKAALVAYKAALRANAAPQGGIPRPDLDHTDGGQAEWPDSPAPEEEMASRTDKAAPQGGQKQAPKWTAAEATALLAFRDAHCSDDHNEAWHQIYRVVSGRAADIYHPWAEVEALAGKSPIPPAAGHAEGGGDTQVVPKTLPDKAYSAGMNYLAKRGTSWSITDLWKILLKEIEHGKAR